MGITGTASLFKTLLDVSPLFPDAASQSAGEEILQPGWTGQELMWGIKQTHPDTIAAHSWLVSFPGGTETKGPRTEEELPHFLWRSSLLHPSLRCFVFLCYTDMQLLTPQIVRKSIFSAPRPFCFTALNHGWFNLAFLTRLSKLIKYKTVIKGMQK